MKIAVINEISAADKNADILTALAGRGHEVLNLGNTRSGDMPALLYIHTGLMSALLLHLGIVDFVIGGCVPGWVTIMPSCNTRACFADTF